MKMQISSGGYTKNGNGKGYIISQILICPVLNNTFQRLVEYPPTLGCRTLDILHVACATVLNADVFVTYDKRQRALALVAGLNVLPPDEQ